MKDVDDNLPLKMYLLGIVISVVAVSINSSFQLELTDKIKTREIAHFIGFIGLSLVMYFYARTCLDKRLFIIMQGIHVPVISVFLVLFYFPALNFIDPLRNAFSQDVMRYVVPLVVLSYLLFSFASFFNFPPVKTNSHCILMVVITLGIISIAWEVIIQPCFDVYLKGPRGFIQWYQVFADFLGIFCAVLFLKIRLKTLKTKRDVEKI
ncbi:hypothetical protein ACED30_12455 [Vibrio splendidus]|uniref:hypothetical protein n=1 Tax=Vibrio splendidus TaxID=29497 RepID=UPI00352D64C3